jgi:hypothetical protein
MSTGARHTMVPDVLDALVAMFAAACPSAGTRLPNITPYTAQEVAVIDGEPVSDLPATYVLVGYSSTFASTAGGPTSALGVEGARVASELSNRQMAESFRVWCEVSSAVGDSDPRAPSRMRRAVADLYSACCTAIDADPTLQGAVQAPAYAQVTDFRWLLDQAPEGYACTVQFAVSLIGEGLVPY